MMIWTLAILSLVVIGWYCYEGRWDRQLFSAEPGRQCANLRVKQALEFLGDHPETQVLDVRSSMEFSAGALPQAINISIGDPAFDQKIAALDKAKPVLIYCAGGFRSRKAVEVLKRMDFTNIQHLHRGYHSWQLSARR